jgi:phosphate-selective porin OprO/OprP
MRSGIEHRPHAILVMALSCVLFCAAAWTAHADDTSLLDVLRQKRVLTPEEYDRLKGTTLLPAQRAGLIEMLRDKGVLTPAEATRIGAIPTAPVPVVKEEAVKPAAAGATPQVGYDEGFFVRSADGSFSLRFNGRVAGNFLFFEPGTTQTNTVTIDRVRLSTDATFYKYFRVRFEDDFASSSGLRDAFIAATPMPEFNLQFGQFKVPFSYEELLSKRYIDFVERSAVVNSTVSPSRDIGVMAHGSLLNRLLQYQLAGMNGAGQNHADNNSDKDVIGRLVIAPFVAGGPDHLRGFNIGGAVSYGHQPGETVSGTTTTTSSIAGLTETGFTFYPAVTRQGKRLRTGAHAAWLDGPYSLSAEYIRTEESRGALPDLDTDGAYIGGTWMLTGEKKPFNARIRPNRRLWGLKSPGWGAWEAALRYEYFKLRHGPDATTASAVTNRYDAIVAGLNWYPNEFLRFSLNYLYGNFEHRGQDRSPNPAKHSNNAVLGRTQLEF